MMEFEEEHEEEEEEEEDSEMAVTPTFKKQPPPQQQQGVAARYRECLKNHAVNIGGHAVDGCGEFLPAGSDGTLDALRCAACNCHRNFHRKELIFDSSNNNSSNFTLFTPRPHHHQHQVYQFYPYNRTSAGYLHVSGGQQQQQQRPPLALPSPTTGGPPKENNNIEGGGGGVGSGGTGSGGTMMMLSGGRGNSCSGKKRFRTKFSPEQKDKMLVLAERLGWRIQKQDEEAVQQFCNETGVKRHVLKVWMHNNKHTLGASSYTRSPTPNTQSTNL